MAESKLPDINARNAKLYKDIEELKVGETMYFDSDEHNIMDYLRAIKGRYIGGKRIKNPVRDFQFAITLASGTLVVSRIG